MLVRFTVERGAVVPLPKGGKTALAKLDDEFRFTLPLRLTTFEGTCIHAALEEGAINDWRYPSTIKRFLDLGRISLRRIEIRGIKDRSLIAYMKMRFPRDPVDQEIDVPAWAAIAVALVKRRPMFVERGIAEQVLFQEETRALLEEIAYYYPASVPSFNS